jgi:hypothetical protein
MVAPGGYILVHDIDRSRKMNERTPEHPWPVYEAMMDFVKQQGFAWSIVKFVRKHLGIIKVEPR